MIQHISRAIVCKRSVNCEISGGDLFSIIKISIGFKTCCHVSLPKKSLKVKLKLWHLSKNILAHLLLTFKFKWSLILYYSFICNYKDKKIANSSFTFMFVYHYVYYISLRGLELKYPGSPLSRTTVQLYWSKHNLQKPTIYNKNNWGILKHSKSLI